MKTSKLAMIASILAIAVMSISVAPNANAKEKEVKKRNTAERVAHMSYDQATQNSGILIAMYEQLDDYILSHNWPYYTVRINYMGSKLYIQGTYQQWYEFFLEREMYMRTHQQ